MSVTVYKKTALTGGTATCLDSVDGALLLNEDMAFVDVSNILYTYILDDDLGGAESSPDIISPDTNPGNKRWVLQGARNATLALSTDLPVTEGGTGRSTSTTAYGLLAAGTTATGAHQTLAAGATTEVLVGGGASALPVWTTATGSGAPVRATSPTLVTPLVDHIGEATAGHGVSIDNPNFTLTNLLTNTQWMACSGSTVCEVTSGAAPVTDGDNAALVNNLLTNGGFDSDTTGWTASNCTLAAIADGPSSQKCLEITRTGAGSQSAYQTVTTVISKLYQITAYTKSGSSGNEAAAIWVSSAALGVGDLVTQNLTTAAGWVASTTKVFKATTTTTYVQVVKNTATAGTMLFDSITLFEIVPGYVAADTLAMDTWQKTNTLDIYRQHTDATYTKNGSFYAMKAVKGADGDEYVFWPKDGDGANAEHLRRFRGRTVTLGMWVYSVTATDNVRLVILDDTWAADSVIAGADGWQWLEFTRTIGASSGQVCFGINFTGDTGDVAYFSQPILAFTDHIGRGNFVPIINEQIYTQQPVFIRGYTATTSAADAVINLETASTDTTMAAAGWIGKGVKAVLVKAYGKDSAAGDGVGFDVQSASGVEDGISVDTQVNNIKIQQQGWVKCDANGDIYFDHRGSGAAALTVDIKVIGVQT